MNQNKTKETDSSLTKLEMIGAFSARLAHALSNHLSIITGNLCVVGALKDNPQKMAAALQGALKAANSAGSILGRFVDLRRSVKNEIARTPMDELIRLMEKWVRARANWRLDSAIQSSTTVACAMNWDWLAFVLDSIAAEEHTGGGVVALRSLDSLSVRANPLHLELQPVGFAQFSIKYASSVPIDWNDIRTNLTDFQLAAAYELLALSGATPESNQVEPGIVLAQFTLPLVAVAPGLRAQEP